MKPITTPCGTCIHLCLIHFLFIAVVQFSFGGVQYQLYTHSFQHAGLDDAFQRSVDILLQSDQDKEKTVHHPCLHDGYKGDFELIPLDGKAPKVDSVTLVGSPNEIECDKLAQRVVDRTASCTIEPCPKEDLYKLYRGKFAALSGFYVVNHFYGLKAPTTISDVREVTDSFCGKHWTDVVAKHRGEMKVESYCFRGEYVEALLEKGLQLNDDRLLLGRESPGWPLGAALVEALALQEREKSVQGTFFYQKNYFSQPDSIIDYILIFIGTIVILSLAVLLLLRVWRLSPLRGSSIKAHALGRNSGGSRDILNKKGPEDLGGEVLNHVPSFSKIENGEKGGDAYLGRRLLGNSMTRSQTYSRKLSALDSS